MKIVDLRTDKESFVGNLSIKDYEDLIEMLNSKKCITEPDNVDNYVIYPTGEGKELAIKAVYKKPVVLYYDLFGRHLRNELLVAKFFDYMIFPSYVFDEDKKSKINIDYIEFMAKRFPKYAKYAKTFYQNMENDDIKQVNNSYNIHSQEENAKREKSLKNIGEKYKSVYETLDSFDSKTV